MDRYIDLLSLNGTYSSSAAERTFIIGIGVAAYVYLFLKRTWTPTSRMYINWYFYCNMIDLFLISGFFFKFSFDMLKGQSYVLGSHFFFHIFLLMKYQLSSYKRNKKLKIMCPFWQRLYIVLTFGLYFVQVNHFKI